MNKHKEIKVILFDLDGTIVDTEPAAARAVAECFAEWGISLSLQDARVVAGRTWNEAFSFLFKRYSVPVSHQEASTEMLSRYRNALANELCVVPGSVQAVHSLSQCYRLGLVSGSWKSEVLWVLDKLKIRQCFEVILGAEDYNKSKPEPDGYLKALEVLEVDSSSGLVFEDSEPGIKSALSAGLRVVAITSTNHFGHDISQAHFQIKDLTEVNPQWVRSLN